MSRAHLLLVDDDAHHLGLLEVGLREAGFDVAAANDGASALERALERGPDLVLGELDLPALDGFSLLEALRAHPRTARTPAVFVTAQRDVEHRARALERGAADHLPKPVYVKELAARVRLQLQRREREALLDEAGGEASGTLADQGLADLVRALGTRTGTVACESDRGEGARIFVSEGRVVDASAGAASGESAFRRALSWRDGRWRFTPGPHGRPSAIGRDTDGLLADALESLKVRDERLAALGGPEAVYEVDFVAVAFRLADLPEPAHGVLRLVDGRRPLGALLKASELDEAATLATLDQLLAEGVVRAAPLVTGADVATDEGPARPPALLDAQGRRLRGAELARALAHVRRESLARQASAPATAAFAAPAIDLPPAIVASEPPPAAAVEPAPPLEPHPPVVTSELPEPEPEPAQSASAATEPEPIVERPSPAEPALDRPPDVVEIAGGDEIELRDCPECRTPVSADALVCDGCGCVLVETTDFSSLLGQPRELRPAVPEVVPVVRFAAQRGARRQRLEREAREAAAAATSGGARPEPLTRELVAPGAAPHPELVATAEAGAAPIVVEPPPVAAAAETPDADPELEAYIAAQGGKSKGPQIAAALVALAAAVGFLLMRDDAPPAEAGSKAAAATAVEAKPVEPAPEPVKPEPAASEPVSPVAQEPAASPEPAADAGTYEPAKDTNPENATAPVPTPAEPPRPVAAAAAPERAPVVAAPAPAPKPAPVVAAPPPAPKPAPVVAPPPAPKPAPVAAPPPAPKPAPVAAPPPAPKPAPVVVAPPPAPKPAPVVAPLPAPKPAPVVAPLEPKPRPPPAPKPVEAETAEAAISPAAAGNFDKLYAEGAAAVKAEKWPKALASLQKALKIKPDAAASRELGKAYYGTDKLDAAKQALEQATRLDAGDADAFLFLGMVLTDLEQKAEAKRAYQRFLALEPPGSARAREINTVLKTLER